MRSVRSGCGTHGSPNSTRRRPWRGLAWAGASGGAHGRRRGAAAGRFGAWWLLATLGDLIEDWPVEPDELGALAAELRWHRWDAHEPTVGWLLQIAVEDVANETAWAITARDAT